MSIGKTFLLVWGNQEHPEENEPLEIGQYIGLQDNVVSIKYQVNVFNPQEYSSPRKVY
jgi:hypothetical protein